MSEVTNGTILNDRYRIDAEIGHGGMGVVYRSYDTALERAVAVKILSKAEWDTEGRVRLLHEAQLAAKLNHPNVVTVFDVGQTDGSPFIVMELVEGHTLRERPPSNLEEIVAVIIQICRALEHAHANDIVHRDLKPENVALSHEGIVKLMDFGIARSVTSWMTEEGILVGTAFYMPPEQALGEAIDGRADLYALGVMFYELTTGKLPFEADDPLAVISQHLRAPVIPPRAKNDRLPGYLDRLIVRLLSKDPDDRPASATVVLQSLETPDILDVEAMPAEELSVLDRIVRGRMVGREAEIQKARELWSKTLAGEGQTLLISGEPGIGKTRLMHEIATHAEVSGGQALIGECHAEGNAPYAAFAQIAHRALRAHAGDGLELPNSVLADMLALAPELRADYPQTEANPKLDPEAEQRRLFENMVKFCTILCEQSPLLLVIEDIHWADGGSLHMLQHLARRTRPQRVMLLGTYREVELDDALPLHEILLDLTRRALCNRVKLERLGQEQTGDLLGIIFAEGITPEFLAGVYTETEGNPFFIEEVCKALIESGQLWYENGKWHRPPNIADMIIPQGVKVAIQSRVSKLTAETQDTLLFAAVIGREFDYDTLRKVTAKDEDALIDSLEEALKAQLVEELKAKGGELFSFSHALIPATLRESVSGLRRTRLHRKVAAVIEELRPEDYERLAHHWGEAGDEERGLAYTIKAAERARQAYANEDAIRLYTEALAILPEDHPERFELLAGRAAVYAVLAQSDAQLADVDCMLKISAGQGDDTRRVDALLALALLQLGTDIAKAREPIEQAMATARELGDCGREGHALGFLGFWALVIDDYHQARKHLEAAVVLLRQAGLIKETGEALSQLSVVLGKLNDNEAALQAVQEATALSKRVGDKRLEADNTRRLATVYGDQHQFSLAVSVAEAALDLHRTIGDTKGEIHALNVLAIYKSNSGMFAESEVDYLQALRIAEAIEHDLGIQFVINNLCELYNPQGDYEKPLPLIEEQIEKPRAANNKLLVLKLRYLKSIQYHRLGVFRQALDILETDLPILEALNLQARMFYQTVEMSEIKGETGEFAEAHQLLESAVELSTRYNIPSSEARISYLRAWLAEREGIQSDLPAALEEAQRAVRLYRGIKSVLHQLVDPLALKVRLHLALIEAAPSHAGQALERMQEIQKLKGIRPDIGLGERDLFLHARALQANGRQAEADEYLHRAYDWMMMAASKIKDDDLRQSYLENVRDNRDIQAAYQARFGSQ